MFLIHPPHAKNYWSIELRTIITIVTKAECVTKINNEKTKEAWMTNQQNILTHTH